MGGTLAPRLCSLEGARIGLLSTGKRNCDLLLGAIGDLLVERHGARPAERWTKPSVYRFSPRTRLEEIQRSCDAAVVGMGDCGHGSACTFHDVFWLEEHGIAPHEAVVEAVLARAKTTSTMLTEAEILAVVRSVA